MIIINPTGVFVFVSFHVRVSYRNENWMKYTFLLLVMVLASIFSACDDSSSNSDNNLNNINNTNNNTNNVNNSNNINNATECSDGVDNDGDGWIDGDDPDCDVGDVEVGLGTAPCNDGIDNDYDSLVDAEDPDCLNGNHDDEDGSCTDVCMYGEIVPPTFAGDSTKVCTLWDMTESTWVDLLQDTKHNRARIYNMWIRKFMMPAGGVANARFTDTNYDQVDFWFGGAGDSAIWTGTYLAGEALRAMVTGSPDAKAHVSKIVETLHHWWHVSGDPGYLARYAAPANSEQRIVDIFRPTSERDHFGTTYNGELWNWIGGISRDQYQGLMLGLSLAYEATDDPDTLEMIRADVVEFVEELMEVRTKNLIVITDSLPMGVPVSVDLKYCVYSTKETDSGDPEIIVDSADAEESTMNGIREFDPEFFNTLSNQIGLLSWIPDIPRSGSAIMLASFFKVALQVTKGVPGYETRRAAIENHYAANVGWWFDIAENELGYESPECGGKYYGKNIRFEPMFNLARLETDPALSQRIKTNILKNIMWNDVENHKNIWFAYIYAYNQQLSGDIQNVVDFHNSQLDMFPDAPRVMYGSNVTSSYTEDPECLGNATEALNPNERIVEDFMWQRHPWGMVSGDRPLDMMPGIDYMAAYWLGRYAGFLTEETPQRCLRYKPEEN
jgi:hypothetical protein